MAARDQKIQSIYNILLTIICVLLLVPMFWFAFQLSTRTKQMEEARQRANTVQTEVGRLTNQQQLVSKMLGTATMTQDEYDQLKTQVTGDATMDQLQDQFNRDMAMFGPNVPATDRNYAKLVEYLMRELRDSNRQVDNANTQLAQAAEENKAVMAREREAAANEKKRADDLEKQLAAERADFTAKIDATQKTIEDVSKNLTLANQNHAKEKNKLLADIAKAETEAKDLRKLNADLREEINKYMGEDFQTPQGQIASVGVDGQNVYINLGKRDGLRVGTRFIVLDPDQVKVAEVDDPKARIEVVQVNEKLARARMLEQSNANPIVPGDLVYSVTWQPGRATEFALLGKMDLNGDGVDDRDIVKDLIRESGGVVVEELTPDGKLTGKMTSNTRWLVIGETYKDNGEMDNRAGGEYMNKYSDMLKRSKDLAVTKINLDKLMNFLRSNSDDRSIPFGNASRPEDFDMKERLPSSRGTVSDIYKQLRPEGPLSGN